MLEGGGAGQGVKTKVFLLRIGGFDTHANQVENYDPTMGVHAAQMHHIASAMKAFQDDLKARGLEEKVLTMTTSEFVEGLDRMEVMEPTTAQEHPCFYLAHMQNQVC